MLDAWVLPHLNISDLIEFSMAVTLGSSENYYPLMPYNGLKYLHLHSDQQSHLIQTALKTSASLCGRHATLDENLSILLIC